MMQVGKSNQLLSLKICHHRDTLSLSLSLSHTQTKLYYLCAKVVCIKSKLPQLAIAANNLYIFTLKM